MMKNLSAEYRGLTKDGKWVYGWYAKIEEKYCITTTEARFDYEEDYNVIFKGIVEVIPETVGRFTNVEDENGIKIYGSFDNKGGDVVEIAESWEDGSKCDEAGERYEVAWCEFNDCCVEGWTWCLKGKDYMPTIWSWPLKVIGSVYDHADLLGELK